LKDFFNNIFLYKIYFYNIRKYFLPNPHKIYVIRFYLEISQEEENKENQISQVKLSLISEINKNNNSKSYIPLVKDRCKGKLSKKMV
jgi:hypothetical protein